MSISERFFRHTYIEFKKYTKDEVSPLSRGKADCIALLQGIPTEICFFVEPGQEKFSLGIHTNLQKGIEALTALWQDDAKLEERRVVKQALKLYEKGMRLALVDEATKITLPFSWLMRRSDQEEVTMYKKKLRYFLTLLAPISG